MQQNDYTENLFRSVDTIIAERIKHLPYDTTQLMEITDDNNANAGIYKVKLDSSEQVIAYADNPKYQIGDQVYVLNTADGDRRFILGTFQKNPVGRIDRSNSELNNLNDNVDKLLNTTQDINASLLILPEKFDLKLQSLDEKFTSLLKLTEQKIDMRFSNVDKQLNSSFEMTAEMLQTQFDDEINGLHSSFLQTAEMFRTEVTDEFNQRWSRITQTADEIKSEVADDINGLYSVIDQTAGEIRHEVHDDINGLHSLIDQTAGEILMQVTDEFNGQQASLDILASGITARVEDMEKGYSEISQTADRISSRVESLYGNYSQILQTADSITSRVEGIEGNYSEILQTADMIQSRVEDVEGNYSEIKQTANMIQSKVEDIEGNYSNIEQTAKEINLKIESVDKKYSYTKQTVDGLSVTTNNGTTYINGSNITTGTITGNQINADEFKINIKSKAQWGNGVAGLLGFGEGRDGEGPTYGVKLAGPGEKNYIIATNSGIRMTHVVNGKDETSPSFYVAGNGAVVDNTSLTVKGNISYTGNLSHASDRNVKNNILYNLSNYTTFYKMLKPTQYKYNYENSDYFHIGFIYQDVEKALLLSGLNKKDFSGLIKSPDNGKTIPNSIDYTEFIALNTYMIQETRKELEEKDNKIQQLENKIGELEQKINLLLETLS